MFIYVDNRRLQNTIIINIHTLIHIGLLCLCKRRPYAHLYIRMYVQSVFKTSSVYAQNVYGRMDVHKFMNFATISLSEYMHVCPVEGTYLRDE